MKLSNTEKRYWNEKFLFFVLECIEYPNRSKSIFDFGEMSEKLGKKFDLQKIFEWSMDVSKEYHLTPTHFGLGREKELKWCTTFDDMLGYMKERPHLQDQNLSLLNFQMIFGKKTKEKIYQQLQKHARLFLKGELESGNKRYLSYSSHKHRFFDIVGKYIEKENKILLFRSGDFGREFRFIECVLALEGEQYFRIEALRTKGNAYEAKAIVGKLLFDTVKKKSTSSKEIREKKEKIPFPHGMIWENMEIKCINDFEIEIFVKNKSVGKFSHDVIGCVDRKSGKPDKQWELLQKLSIAKGELDPSSSCTNIKQKESMRQNKRILSKKLKAFFNMGEDPFYNFKEYQKYKARFAISPVPLLRGDGESRNIKDNPYSDLGDFHKNQTGEM